MDKRNNPILYPQFHDEPKKVGKIERAIEYAATRGFNYEQIAILVLAVMEFKEELRYPHDRFPFRQIKKPGTPSGAPGSRPQRNSIR